MGACLAPRIVAGSAALASLLAFHVCRTPLADDETKWSGEYKSALRLYYHSLDFAPVEVELFGEFKPTGSEPVDPEHKAVLHIPRAYLFFVDQYLPRYTERRVPDHVRTDSITVLMTYPDGKPLSVHAKELAAERGISRSDAIRQLRPVRYEARLSYVRPDWPWEENLRSQRRSPNVRDAEPFEGLAHVVSVLKEDYYYGEPGVDEFVEFRCVEGKNPFLLCEATARIRSDLVAQIYFMDFRQYGGRSFANERIRALRESICRFVSGGC